MSAGDTALRVLGKLAAGLFGAGLLAWAGVTLGERLAPGAERDVDNVLDRVEGAEIEAGAAWRAVISLDERSDQIESRVKRLEARADAAEAAQVPTGTEIAPAAPARRERPQRRKPKPPAVGLPPASSHWRF